ncbi:beta-fructofuranosidase, insoluble isoenzyme CWINV1-like [Punica granatum]|uniref:Beta-fructofuranosidase, insoluble isoenzyme CWINV1-like n=1 Tax=Punica granatum TaxID=22663 RepID=A0A6P8E4J4_PUNGR|nr:beta-fructofuranosidase, insoluble isoenzyme CWINV1-like [Punica granatum]
MATSFSSTSSSSSSAIASLVCVCLLSLLLGHGILRVEASHKVYRHLQSSESLADSSADQPYRTAYHFQPPKNWMNDPNGPMIYKGLYHLFYQWNPKGAVWGNIVWAHSTSKDLVNWIPHEPAIYPSQPADMNGTWSGSATILPNGTPVILYTGINPANQQVQNIAFPKKASDPYLIEWVKTPKNPLMAPTASNMINASSFRDPTTAWVGPDGRWRVIIGSKRGRRGMAILYRSKDFIHWVKAQHPLHSAPNTGMWECPDFFPVSTVSPLGLDTSSNGPRVKHVLKVSLDDTRKEYYTIGTYDPSKKDVYTPDAGSVEGDLGLRFDYGKFYASKTFFDSAKNRRILWGWINESSSVEDDIKKGWSGLQAVPRVIWLDKSGKQLVQWPVMELEKLRTGRVDVPSKLLRGGSKFEVSGFTASQADVELSFEVKNLDKAEKFDPSWVKAQDLCTQKTATVKGGIGPFGIMALASKGLEEYTAIFFRIFKGTNNKYVVAMCSDQTKSSLNNSTDKANYGAFLDVDPAKEKLSLRTLIDRSIVESFGGEGKGCITARVYPTKAIGDGAHLYAFNYGAGDVLISSFSAWSMKKAQIN